ncbi:MAG TPA: DinB family protein [Thermoanaerobaculia bacterium]|nr:DinB family protein [Thermoanaerobaculia bacterium]
MRSIVTAVLLIAAAPLLAQDAGAPKRATLPDSVRSLYQSAQRNVTEAAEVMPEDQYSFKPTPEVRSFGEIIGHVANSQYFFCSSALGVPNPNKANLEGLKTKKELVDALKESNTFCDGAYAPSQSLDAPASLGKQQTTKGHALIFNLAHDNEHYGNLVTYLRLKGIVPPSTARAKAASSK